MQFIMISPSRSRFACALLIAFAVAGCSTNKANPTAKAAAPPAPVSVVQAVSKTVPLELQADNAAIESARANIAADQAALDRAKLQLEYCTIVSPIDGRTGRLFVKQGNIVKANDMDLVTINQLRPIYASFAIPETELPSIKSHMARGRVTVTASKEGNPSAETGTLTFVENAVDSATGTIRMKAVFEKST